MKDGLEDYHREADQNQHLDGRERHLAMAADIVAHQIARTPQQLHKRTGKRTGVEAPKQRDVIADGAPTHPTHLGTLAAARTEVVGKLRAAVMAMPHLALMPVDIVRLSLLPAAETVVILY